MGLWDRFRGKDGGGKESDRGADASAASASVPGARYLSAEESPFAVRTLDLRPVTQGLLSTTKDPANAQRAISWELATAEAIPPLAEGAAKRTISCALEYEVAPAFTDGLLFAPRAMEEKWALFHRASSIIAVRSWTGQVPAVAHGTRVGDRLVIEALTVVEGGLGPFEDQPALFDWLVRTHALGQALPLPVSASELDVLAASPLLAFSIFGRMAELATNGFSAPAPGMPLRVFGAVLQAARRGDVAEVRRRLAAGAAPDVPSPVAGHAALHVAMVRGDVEVMRALLVAGAMPNLRTDRGMTPIGLGIVHGAPAPVLEELLAAGAALYVTNVDGFGLLHAAAETNRPEIVSWLVGRGLDVEFRTASGLAPLHIACGLGHANAARALIATGADPRSASPLGTPRDIAEKEGHAELARLLPSSAS